MFDVVVMYFVGVVTGLLTAWFVLAKRRELSPGLQRLAHDAATYEVFVRATSDVVDESTGEEIEERTNELLDEYDIPGDPSIHFGR